MLLPGAGSAKNSGHRGYLVFHLDEDASDFRKSLGKMFGYFSGGSDGIAGKKTAAGNNRPFRACGVPVKKMLSGENSRFHRKRPT